MIYDHPRLGIRMNVFGSTRMEEIESERQREESGGGGGPLEVERLRGGEITR